MRRALSEPALSDHETTASDVVQHAVELPVSFHGGTGWTQTVSREEMRLTTTSRLAAGDSLEGDVRFLAEEDGSPIVVHYGARIISVHRRMGEDGTFDVHVRFERLAFVVAKED